MRHSFFSYGFCLVLCLISFSQTAHAIKLGEVELPDVWTQDSENLVLNGAGFREYSFLKVKVYAAALYLIKPEQRADQILKSPEPKVILVRTLRDVSQTDSIKAWKIYLEANCISPCAIDPQAQQQFMSLIPESKAGDAQTYFFSNGTLELYRNGLKIGSIKHAAFSQLVLAKWIGAVPSTEALKRALLGIAPR
jgi:hypothetical protein